MLFESARWYDVRMVRKLCLLAAPSFSQMPYTRLFLLALKEKRAGWKCVRLLCPQGYSSGKPPPSQTLEVCVSDRVGVFTSS